MALLDLIEYIDEDVNEIVHRVPEYGSGEFRLGSQCVVRESQVAIFFRDGKALDLLPPGRHTLSTANIPLLTGLIGLPFGSKSPFRAEVYYVSQREFTSLKWGTPQPVTFRDKEFGLVRIRAHGTYTMRVADAQLLVTRVVGTRSSFRTTDIEEQLRSNIVNEFNDMLGETLTSLLDVQGMSLDLATAAQHALADDFAAFGLELRSFQITAITPPDEVQAKIDERTSMGIIGDMRAYTQYQTAQAIGRMGEGDGGGGGGGTMTEGAGLGAGMGMGMAMGQAMRDAMGGGGAAAPASVPASGSAAPVQGSAPAGGAAATGGTPRFCSECGHALPAGAKFCPGCGRPIGA